MTQIGFHASHELFAPRKLLALARMAEQVGFACAMCSDHFHPWSERQGQSGFAWSWLGAAMEATRFSFGTVCAPGQRYHPAIIAQASATLAQMYPGRFWVAIGSGEALNESITGEPWPQKSERNERLKQAADVIRRLWSGERVNFAGHFKVREAKLYTRPEVPPKLFGAALTPETAAWMASWADGLITAGSSHDGLKKIVSEFRANGGAEKSVYLQSAVCYAATKQEALMECHHQWRHAALDMQQISDLPTPVDFDRATAHVTPDELESKIRMSDSLQQHLDWIMQDAELGFERIYLHYVGRNVEMFLDAFRGKLPLAKTREV